MKIEEEMKVILVSRYLDIVNSILIKHSEISVAKLLVFSYIINKNNATGFFPYDCKTKHDVVLKCISQISGLYDDFLYNIEFIFLAIKILKESKILVQNGNIILINSKKLACSDINNFINKAIDESKNKSDRQFLKEVLNNV